MGMSPPYRKTVVDTGPLFSLLTLIFIRQRPTYQNIVLADHRLPEYVIQRQRDFLEFFASIRKILFTSHVVGQIQRRGGLKRAGIDREFWLCSLHYLSN